MEASGKTVTEEVIEHYAYKLMLRLQFKGITKGASKVKRMYTHVFVRGEIYGGKLGTFLCKAGWHDSHVYEAGSTMLDLCPTCKKRLRIMAEIAANSRPSELFGVAGGSFAKDLTDKEIDNCLREMSKRERVKKVKFEQEGMFDNQEVTRTITRTPLCTVTMPSP